MIVAHPSPDLYGSDLQLLASIEGFRDAGWAVTVTLPRTGPLVAHLLARGADVRITEFPVLSKSLLAPRRLPGLVVATVRALWTIRRDVVASGAAAVWVNTLTEPVWVLAARLARRQVVCHVHEAEEAQPWPVRALLAAPLLLAHRVVVNSAAARRALTQVLPALARRTELVYNGMEGPPDPLPAARRRPGQPFRIALVGRLSPRKGTDVALEAVALLRAGGADAVLDLFGDVFPGYEWFEDQLRRRADEADLRGAVRFHGYVNPVWGPLGEADAVVVPSRAEPFGNVAVEAMLAERPVVASAVQGLTEIVTDGTGLLAPVDDAPALAGRLRELYDDPDRAAALAAAGLASARDRFGAGRYREQIAQVLGRTAARRQATR
ncbi:glycosyltransferase family 4 protein [Cellulomonas fengjieae]|uniref:glycosyltransferase family 4 protein n=1 Tax=Cellulomonas fengjieae TaxID=2819978 RepID=UPI001AB000F6|nr:glycosyltransferase family 4 protein [Cellulomonas fengjieae]MBO3100539.1 glycosyltransferase family 4 protein [Cellulomonas fengjieae]